ncbi:uncharacterized protein LAJ45_10259 [Morchella importuna]|uniref:uncharacterized protein n=1 Tax=Morchella importuna TaxID=1174673 RepID=UPI001E8EB336|nr:uncharacterized protein LAJ45_10259 [Morchella importuna]KAH8145782.1 hypothetical protein LAJ45_10259 [Morchella importuna]
MPHAVGRSIYLHYNYSAASFHKQLETPKTTDLNLSRWQYLRCLGFASRPSSPAVEPGSGLTSLPTILGIAEMTKLPFFVHDRFFLPLNDWNATGLCKTSPFSDRSLENVICVKEKKFKFGKTSTYFSALLNHLSISTTIDTINCCEQLHYIVHHAMQL